MVYHYVLVFQLEVHSIRQCCAVFLLMNDLILAIDTIAVTTLIYEELFPRGDNYN